MVRFMEDTKAPFHVLMPISLLSKLNDASEETGWTKAELTRKALTFYLDQMLVPKKKGKK